MYQITALYNFGKFQYSYGNYSGAADYLYHFRVLSTDLDLTISAHWGKLASDILTGKWDVALEELNSLREAIDSRSPAPFTVGSTNMPAVDPALTQLHSRTWLVHWPGLVTRNGPWILRYVAAAAITSTPTPTPSSSSASSSASSSMPQSSRVKNAVREVVKVIRMENYQYLHVEFDFEAAQKELQKAEKVVSDDFFLGDFHDEFLECEVFGYDLSDRPNLPRDEGEKWIVNLIRETCMGQDAKIDLEKNLIQISRPPQPVYQSVIEKTRGLAMRMQALGAAIARIRRCPCCTAERHLESTGGDTSSCLRKLRKYRQAALTQAPRIRVELYASSGTDGSSSTAGSNSTLGWDGQFGFKVNCVIHRWFCLATSSAANPTTSSTSASSGTSSSGVADNTSTTGSDSSGTATANGTDTSSTAGGTASRSDGSLTANATDTSSGTGSGSSSTSSTPGSTDSGSSNSTASSGTADTTSGTTGTALLAPLLLPQAASSSSNGSSGTRRGFFMKESSFA
ncbi:hypothetical protein BT96DRAFT_980617 [Gymnopus androsaceus JB14]|uniref:Uncharacterized protein n=1 Tax=Gymnopus androsaceus JB14 TaxID=1447944 RepID=A0A6A4GXE8_9AGAR|nr:hypothetical protein BT96DRAFT_980617 [Gymnopus androsaceus JB14]